jgi:hypothetical protein
MGQQSTALRKKIELRLMKKKHGQIQYVLPLMAIPQPKKDKVRPVLDYRNLNDLMESFPGSYDAVCQEKIRKWRKRGTAVKFLDLRKAYLQLHAKRELWVHQAVKFENQYYLLTRLGFGVCVAPKILAAVVSFVLSYDSEIKEATDAYYDDILVAENENVDVTRVRELLKSFGLVTKEPAPLKGGRVLGLDVLDTNDEKLCWKRSDDVPMIIESEPLTRRKVTVFVVNS